MTALQMSLFSPRWQPQPAPPARVEAYSDPFYASILPVLDAAGDAFLTFDEGTWDHTARSATVCDVEVYRNFFCACFKRLADGKKLAFELSPRRALDKAGLRAALEGNLIVTFNGNSYDLVIVYAALAGASNATLKVISDRIVKEGASARDVAEVDGVRVPNLRNHIDLAEPNHSVRQGLKMLNGRLHGRYMVDLPYAPDAALTPREMNVTTLYCFDDIEKTELLYGAMRGAMELRVAMGRELGVDLRSKSDAQIGELVVKLKVERATGRRAAKPAPGAVASIFGYEPPAFLKFDDPRLSMLVDELGHTTFGMGSNGKIIVPAVLEGLKIGLGAGTYSLGIGGIHSNEANRRLLSDDARRLIDVDVASQYPNIIMKLGLYPAALGPAFLKIYSDIIKERLDAKRRLFEIENEITNLERSLKNYNDD